MLSLTDHIGASAAPYAIFGWVCPTKIMRCHLRFCLVQNSSWRAAVDFWTQKTDLPMLGKQEKDSEIL